MFLGFGVEILVDLSVVQSSCFDLCTSYLSHILLFVSSISEFEQVLVSLGQKCEIYRKIVRRGAIWSYRSDRNRVILAACSPGVVL